MTNPVAGLLRATGQARSSAQAMLPIFETDLMVLNYALTLEHLENAFYKASIGLG